jgi:hypothetical protein
MTEERPDIIDLMNEKLNLILEILGNQNKMIVEISKLNFKLLKIMQEKLDLIIINQNKIDPH